MYGIKCPLELRKPVFMEKLLNTVPNLQEKLVALDSISQLKAII
jgi:hypothetical protein